MIKELKYLIYTICIFIFIILIGRYYFSDENKKKSFRSLSNIDKNLEIYAKKLPILESDTKNIIEYIEQKNLKKKKYNFWKLLEINE